MKFSVNVIKQIIIILLVGILSALSACDKPPAGPESVKVGLIVYTEDEHRESMGLPTINAAQLAVDQINRAGGVKLHNSRANIDLVVEGVVASSPQNAVAAVRKLTNRDNVAAIVGLHYSVDAIPAGAFAEKAQMPFISPMSTNSRTTEGRNFVYRMSFVDELQGSVMARFAYHDLGSRRAAVLFDRTDPYSSGIAEVFSSTYLDLGGAVVSWQPYVHQQVDYDLVIDRIKMSEPDILYLPGFSVDVIKQVEKVKANGLNVQLLGADGWEMHAFSKNPLFDNTYATTHWFEGADFAGSDQFIKTYTELYKSQPDAVAALTYDAMHLIFTALEYAGSIEGVPLQQALMKMEGYSGVSGTVDFVDSGDPEKGVIVLKLKDREISLERIVERGEY